MAQRVRANPVSTQKVTLSTTPKVIRLLEQLAMKELFGKNPAAVAEELVRGALRELIKNGELEGDE